jgi:hypothetical protein
MFRPRILQHLACVVVVLVMLSGCTTHLRNKQLEEVAKDWSFIVRASQVIPVYPLTEDLQPGDVLLVNTPIDEQVKIYKKKGFLPLDQLLKRLNPSEYRDFYQGRYGTDDKLITPAQWQRMVSFHNHTTSQWNMAPHAAFPTYKFTVNSGAGVNLAIPVQGVPLALGLMNSGKAKGSMTIGKSYTYGLDNSTLRDKVERWAAANRELLRSYRPVDNDGKKKYIFLRVVSRVYAISDINVTMQNDEATSGELRGGADKNVPIQILAGQDTAENYKGALGIFNDVLKDQLPGGKVKVAMASSRVVSLNEQFDRPLIIGYVGFDMPILEGGRLGAPISTLSQLNDTPILLPEASNNIYRLAAFAHMHQALQDIPGPRADEIRKNLDTLGTLLPETYPFTLYEYEDSSHTDVLKSTTVVSGAKIEKRDFRGVLGYLSNGKKTVDTLERYLANTQSPADREEMAANFRTAQEAIEKLNQAVGKQPALAEAVDFVFLGY